MGDFALNKDQTTQAKTDLGPSFVEPLLPKIVEAYRSALPERPELVERLQTQLASVDVDDRAGSFAAIPTFGVITASWWALETIWCCAYSIAALGPLFDKALAEGHREFDPLSTPYAFIAEGLLGWAARTAENGERIAWLHANIGWPYHLDDPTHLPDGPLIAQAEQVFLGAVGWILLHELAHIDLGHGRDDRPTLELEREADATATRWLFEQAPFGDATARGEGLVCAVLYMWIREFQSEHDDPDHPPVGDRLESCMAQADLHRNAWPKCLMSTVADMFFQRRSVKTPGVMKQTFATCDEALAALTAAVRSHKNR